MLDTATLRSRLIATFSDEELRIFIYDNFRQVHDELLTAGMTRAQQVQLLIEHCERRRELPRLLELLREERPGAFGESAPSEACPYLGLNTFSEQDAGLFFGRDALVEQLLAKTSGQSFLTVIGPSGSGKSSAVLAGLLPALHSGALPDSASWAYLAFKPGARPLDALAALLGGEHLGEITAVRKALDDDERALLLAADRLATGAKNRRLVLIVDQFEELYTLANAGGNGQQARFVSLLLAAVTAPATPLLALLTMRADFLHRAAESRELARLMSEHLAIVSPMVADELREAIERPAALAGCRFEPGLVDELVGQVAGRAGALPLLEYTLQELWRARRPDGTLTWEALRDLGGVEGALARRADAMLGTYYSPDQQRDLRKILLRLVQPGEGAADTRRRALLDDLVPASSSVAAIQALLKPLADERLLTTGQDTASGEETVEISHEALIRAWPTFNAWISEARADLRQQLQLEEAARQWEGSRASADFLWSGLRLANAEEWVTRAQPALTQLEASFLNASRAAEDERASAAEEAQRQELLLRERAENARRNARRLAFFAGVVGVLAVVAIVLAVIAYTTGQVAQAQARGASALVEREVARPDRALLLTRAAADELGGLPFYELPVSRAVRSALQTTWPSQELPNEHGNEVWITAFSPDGTRLLTASKDRTARIWDAATRQRLLVLEGHEDFIFDAAWSPDGRLIATGSGDMTARIWDAQSGASLHLLAGHTDHVIAVNWSPNGDLLATASNDGTARIWDAGGALLYQLSPTRQLGPPAENPRPLSTLVWSPSGDRLLTGDALGVVRIWDAKSGREARAFYPYGEVFELPQGQPPNSRVRAAAWYDENLVITAHEDGGLYVFNIAGAPQLVTYQNSLVGVRAPAFTAMSLKRLPQSEQGGESGTDPIAYLVTGDENGRVLVWSLWSDYIYEIDQLPAHRGQVVRVAWSPDGRWVLSSSDDKTAQVWNQETGEVLPLRSHISAVGGAAWSPDSKYVLTGSADGSVRLWPVQLQPLSWIALRAPDSNFSGAGIFGAAWSPDDTRVLVGSGNSTGYIIDTHTSAVLHTLEGHEGAICAVAWSPDGSQAATASADGSVIIWDAASGSARRTFQILDGGDGAFVNTVAWNPADGTRLAIGDDAGLLTIWNSSDGQMVESTQAHNGRTLALAWSPDGSQIATAGSDGAVVIWEAPSGAELRRMRQSADTTFAHIGWVRSVGWSPDGDQLISGGDDRTIRLWNAADGSLRGELSGANNTVRVVGFSPDGAQVASTGDDGIVRIWSAENNRPLQAIEEAEEEGGLFSMAWSPDGRQMLSGSFGGAVHITLLDQGLMTAELTRRLCSVLDDAEIEQQINGWNGCRAELDRQAAALNAYDGLREQP